MPRPLLAPCASVTRDGTAAANQIAKFTALWKIGRSMIPELSAPKASDGCCAASFRGSSANTPVTRKLLVRSISCWSNRCTKMEKSLPNSHFDERGVTVNPLGVCVYLYLTLALNVQLSAPYVYDQNADTRREKRRKYLKPRAE
jgi:hypothetical protein